MDGPNLYTYVRQNPWTKFDPTGLAENWMHTVNETSGGDGNVGYGNLDGEMAGLAVAVGVTAVTMVEIATSLQHPGVDLKDAISLGKGMLGGFKSKLAGKADNVAEAAAKQADTLGDTARGRAELARIIPTSKVDEALEKGFPEKPWPTVAPKQKLENVDLNNPQQIVDTIYNKYDKTLQQTIVPSQLEEFKKGATLVEIRPSVPVVPAGRTNMTPQGVPQYRVKGDIEPQEIKVLKSSDDR